MERIKRTLTVLAIFFALFSLMFSACQTAPVTGRYQLILIPESMEVEMGLTSYKETLKKAKLSEDKESVDRVRRVGERIAEVADRKDYKWEFNLIDADKVVNAFALPGGKVAVYTGILKYTEGDAGLAAVMGHEVAHALVRHGGERISAGILAQLGMIGLSTAIKNKDPVAIGAINQAYGIGVNVGVLLPFSRSQELEADRVGLVLMAKAGYDPNEAVAFWKRMMKGKDKAPPEFLSTHPATDKRIRELEQWLPEAMKYYKPSPPS
ncbi:MAG: M48 family metallopeptidase [Nitrospirae bacterium]|nr:M48 family metallopeptidase [Nitrospirota bacterium]